MKKVMRFGKKGKLSPRHVGPFEVLKKVGALAYRVTLPPKLGKIHNMFCKTRENSNFRKKCKIVISVKIQNFSRSRMKKQSSQLESSHEI